MSDKIKLNIERRSEKNGSAKRISKFYSLFLNNLRKASSIQRISMTP